MSIVTDQGWFMAHEKRSWQSELLGLKIQMIEKLVYYSSSYWALVR